MGFLPKILTHSDRILVVCCDVEQSTQMHEIAEVKCLAQCLSINSVHNELVIFIIVIILTTAAIIIITFGNHMDTQTLSLFWKFCSVGCKHNMGVIYHLLSATTITDSVTLGKLVITIGLIFKIQSN